MPRTIELHKRRYLDKNMFDGQIMNLKTDLECKDAHAGDITRKSPEASPPPAQVVMPPPSSPLSLRRKVSTSQRSEFNVDCEDQCAVTEASTPEISKTLPIDPLGPGRRPNKTLLRKDATSHNNTSLQQRRDGGKRLDPVRKSKEASDSELDKPSVSSRKSKELSLLQANKRHDHRRKSTETFVKGRNKPSDSLRKYKELSGTSETGPKTSLETTGIEAHQILQKPQETSIKTGAAQKNSGPGFLQATTSYNERKTIVKKTLCVVANDGRVAAHSSEPSVHKRCKHRWCAANDPDYLSPPAAGPKKYLVSKRHLLKAQIASKCKDNKSLSVLLEQNGKLDNLFSSQKGEASFLGMDVLVDGQSYIDDGVQHTPKLDSGSESPESKNNDQTPFEINDHCLESGGEQVDGKTSARLNKVHRSYIHLTQEQEAEPVKLRRQLIQERKQAGEWMIDSAIEEAIQKLAPSGETTVKVLVEAFESIISHNDDEIHDLHWDGSHDHTAHCNALLTSI